MRPLDIWIREQVLRQRAVQVHHGVAVKGHCVYVLNQQFYRSFVVQNHLCFKCGLARCSQAVLDQFAGVQPRVSVTFQLAGCPRQIDQQAIKNCPAVRACRQTGFGCAANSVKLLAQCCWQVSSFIGLVVCQKLSLIANWFPGVNR